MVRGRDFVTALRRVEQGYREASRELTLDEWEKRRIGGRVLDNLARLTSAVQ
jgi:cardiolipin synthase